MTNSYKADILEWLDTYQATAPTRSPGSQPVFLSVVIPAYNEESRILRTLLSCLEYLDQSYLQTLPTTENWLPFEVIIVDDGSSDATADLVQLLATHRDEVSLVRLPSNKGKGAAVRKGVHTSRGTHILITDADGSTPIEELSRLLPFVLSGYDLAIGSRAVLDAETSVEARSYRKVLGKLFNVAVNTLLIPEVADSQCGFKLFKKKAGKFLFLHSKCDGFGFDPEILFISNRCGLKVKEVAVNWHHVRGSKVNLALDSMKMLLGLFQFRMQHRKINRSDFEAFSVKQRK